MAELTDEVEWRLPKRVRDAEPALELEGVTVEPGPGEIGAYDITLQVLKSEIMGIAGVDGNGQRELAEAIAGQRSLAGGDIRLFGYSLAKSRVAQRRSWDFATSPTTDCTRGRSAPCRWR